MKIVQDQGNSIYFMTIKQIEGGAAGCRNAGPLPLFQGDSIFKAYAMLHLSNNPLTGSRAFIGRVGSASAIA
jgi:hypothetical protein